LQLSGFDEDITDEPEHGEEDHVVSLPLVAESLRDVGLQRVGEPAAVARDGASDLALGLAPVRLDDRIHDPPEEIAPGRLGGASG
jgi:hypothetical protein